ncbi:uncharacterized protein [Dermacentor albipictus]|uniref:uncharacterized protein isoform X2 n=1 Tax=Dermacentor albipictus TaxID=60249 RepID=UPI0038FC372C
MMGRPSGASTGSGRSLLGGPDPKKRFWREVVMRAINSAGGPGQDNGRPMADVYYHTSSGLKLRSRPEVAAYLANNREIPLTVDHFTFVRLPIHKPPHEIVRKATLRGTPLPAPADTAPTEGIGGPPREREQRHASDDTTTGRRMTRKRLCCCEDQHSSCKQLRLPGKTRSQLRHKFSHDHVHLAAKTRLTYKGLRTQHGPHKGTAKRFDYTAKYKAHSLLSAVPKRPLRQKSSASEASGLKSTPRNLALPSVGTQSGDATKDSKRGSQSPFGKQRCSQKRSPSSKDKYSLASGSWSPREEEGTLGCDAVNELQEAAALVEAATTRYISSEPRSLREFRMSKQSQETPDSPEGSVPTSDACSHAFMSIGSKHPVVLVKDFLKGLPSASLRADMGKKTSAEETTVALVTPNVRRDYWQNTAAWDIYKLLQARRSGVTLAVTEAQGQEQSEGMPWGVTAGCNPASTEEPSTFNDDASVEKASCSLHHLAHRLAHPSVAQSKSPAIVATSSVQRSCEPCSLGCPRAQGQTPQLLCTRCLCLFHAVCAERTSSHPAAAKGRFICKACIKKPNKTARTLESMKAISESENATASCNSTNSKPEITWVQVLKEPATKTITKPLHPSLTSASTATVHKQCSSFSITSIVTCTTPSSSSCTAANNMPATSSSSSTISVPVIHVVASGGTSKPASMAGPSTGGAQVSYRPAAQVAPRPRLPLLLPAPPRLGSTVAAGNARAPKIPTLRFQSMSPQNLTVVPSLYCTIQLTQNSGNMSDTQLKSLVSHLVQKRAEELQKMGSGQTIVLQAPLTSPSVQAPNTVQLPSLPSQVTAKQRRVLSLPETATTSVQATTVPLTSVLPVPLNTAAREAVRSEPIPTDLVLAVLEGCDRAPVTPVQHSVMTRSLLRTGPKIASVTSLAVGAGERQESLQETMCADPPSVPASAELGVVTPIATQVVAREVASAPVLSYASRQCTVISGMPKMDTARAIAPKLEPGAVHLPLEARRASTPEAAEATKLNAVYMALPGHEASTSIEGASRVITAEEEKVIYGLNTLPVEPPPSIIITSSYSLACGPMVQDSDPSSVSHTEYSGGHKTVRKGLSNAAKADKPSDDGTSTFWCMDSNISKAQIEVIHEVVDMQQQTSCNQTEVPSEVNQTVNPLQPHSLCSSGHIGDGVIATVKSADTECQQPEEKVPVNCALVSSVPCSPKAVKVRHTKSKRHHCAPSNSDLSGVSIWVDSGGQLTYVRDRPSVLAGALQLEGAVSRSPRSMQDLTEGFTVLNHIFKWLSTPSLCKVAQVCHAWRMVTSIPYLWKRVDFRQLHVHNWDACVGKLKHMQTEELVLDKESLDPVLSRNSQLEAVQLVVLEVNPLQLVCLAGAFPRLRSLSATITRKGGGAVGRETQHHPASLGGLSELLCVAGLERLELRGAHGLALLPLTMPAHNLAQRCQNLRALSLVTVQNMTPAVVFLVSLLHGLEELHLGDCINWSEMSFVNIGRLKQLRRLTLERGEDNDGFRSMLLRLDKLQRLDLKRWTLRNSLADTLCKMSELRHLLFWPLTSGLTVKTNRNILRSCLATGPRLKRITWVVSCKKMGAPISIQQVALDMNLAFESGTLCECPPLVAASCYASVPESAANDIPRGLSPRARKSTLDLDSREVSSAPSVPSPTGDISPCCRKSVKPRCVSGASPVHSTETVSNSSMSSEQLHLKSTTLPMAPCCALAKTLLEVWRPSMHQTWYMTPRQLCQGLKHCLGPNRDVCVCVRIE